MKLVVGLGNPGPRYARTRHNVGFDVVDLLATRWNTEVSRYDRRFDAMLGEAQRADQRVLLLKPQTYMNLSGKSVLAARQFYKLDLGDLLIVHDDLDLPCGRLRLRARGSGGGQRGLENILLRLGATDVPRLRIGIGKVHKSVTSDYVLSRFAPDELEIMNTTLQTAADAVECWISEGIDAAMTRFNAGTARPDAP
ncbi:MAG: aminoacyl-tRNA hydrolase [Planctomycetota bacterium]|nr:MAG: aminoacyl-tRNA hydrolase [Planctomycetota bacterium]